MGEPKENPLMEKIVSLCKRRGFIYQSSEIYGGINGFWDYGPLGAELKRNVKELWWRDMVQLRDSVVGLEATIIMSPEIWKASGHVETFADMMVECPLTKKRFRADQVEPQSGTEIVFTGYEVKGAGVKRESPFVVLQRKGVHLESVRKLALQYYVQQYDLADGTIDGSPVEVCEGSRREVTEAPNYNPENGVRLSDPRPFNLMFKTYVGPVESEDNVAYLRPETAQAIFAQFKNVLETSRQKVPFGIAQIGKAFRNEVTPRNFTFRSREFEQMELEFFITPDEATEAIAGKAAVAADVARADLPVGQDAQQRALTGSIETPSNWGWEAWHQYWVEERIKFYEGIGLPRTTLVEYWQTPEELAHYARATVDILFKFPFSKRDEKGELMGEELEGVAARSDFDLSQHERFSGKPMGVFDDELRAAWAKLDEGTKKKLRQRYYEARLKYLTKTGVEQAQAEKDAKEDADGLAKGQYIPHVIEPSAGVDRLILALICNAYYEDQMPDEKGKMETRVVMKLHPRVAPIKVGVLPLLKNKPDLVKKALEVRDLLRPHMKVFYDDGGAIGRRYRRQDEAGTPFCVTIDFDTLGEKGQDFKNTVTLRHRDDGRQDRVKIADLPNLLLEKIR